MTERELADQLFDYSMSVAALRSQVFDLLNDKYDRDIEGWKTQFEHYYKQSELPDFLFLFMERYRSRGKISDDYAERRMSND